MSLRARLKDRLFRNRWAFRHLGGLMRFYSVHVRDRVTDGVTWVCYHILGRRAHEAASQPPGEMIVTPATYCNAKCNFCSYPKVRQSHSTMSLEDFRLAVSQFAALGGKVVKFAPTLGEVFFDPSLFEKIEYCHSLELYMKLVNNGYMLAVRDNALRLARSGVHELFVSCGDVVPALDAATYGLSEAAATRKFDAIVRMAVELEALQSRSTLVLLMRPDRPIGDVMDDMVRTPLWQHYLSGRLLVHWMHAFDNWSGMIAQEDLKGVQRVRIGARLKLYPCTYLFDWSVLPGGEVRLCGCSMKETMLDELVIGNVHEAGLSEIWDSERRKSIVERFVAGDLPTACQNCTLYVPRRKGDQPRTLE